MIRSRPLDRWVDLSDYKDKIVINANNRKKKVIEFVSINKGCYKQEVVKDAINKGYGSKETIYDVFEELEAKKLLNITKDKPNSKFHRLSIEIDNPVMVLMNQLNQINDLLNAVIDKFYRIYIKSVKNWPQIRIYRDSCGNKIDPSQLLSKNSSSQLAEVAALLYYLICFISDSFEYHSKSIWPNYDIHYRDQLYSMFFTQLGDWYNLINNKISCLVEKYEQDVDDYIIPPKLRKLDRSRLTFSKEYRFKLYQPLYKIQLLENNFKSHGVGEEYKKLIDYLFDLNIAYIDIVYPELIGYESLDIIKDDKYLEKYIKRFKKEYEEYCKRNGIPID